VRAAERDVRRGQHRRPLAVHTLDRDEGGKLWLPWPRNVTAAPVGDKTAETGIIGQGGRELR
jgi:hypothetical protein